MTARPHVAALLTAAALLAQQVGSNAMRDGLFLSFFPVQSLPYFMAGAALLAVIAAQVSGRLLARFGPVRVAPVLFASHAALFVAEWLLLGVQPSAATVVLYLHASVFGAIAISAFWSLLNERFDPHSAKPLMTRVAGAATCGGLIGGVGAERVAALLPQGALLPLLGLLGGVCVAGARALGRGAPVSRSRGNEPEQAGGWIQLRRQPLLRDLAFVVALAAMVAGLVDYLLKAEAVAYFGKGPGLVRFFGLFYAGTGLAAVLMQTFLGRVALGRLGLAGSVATHPAMVGAAALLGFVLPSPLRSILPRGLDVVARASIFRAGYELLYTPLAEAAKRSAKSLIDVACDCAGKMTGALLILLLVGLAPSHPIGAVNLAAVIAAAAELFFARRLRSGYVSALQGGLQRQGQDFTQAVEYSLSDFTVAGGMAGLDRTAVLQALGSTGPPPTAAITDQAVAAIAEFRSGDLLRIRAALRDPPKDPLIIAALVQLLARDAVVRLVVSSLAGFGVRAAGEMVSVLLDPATSDVVRRRLPLALRSCPSAIARDGLLAALEGPFDFEIRLRCGRALLALTEDHPDLQKPFAGALTLVERELRGDGEAHQVREHVFNLLGLVLEREPVRIAARAFTTEDSYVRGTALEYLETVLPAQTFSALRPLLAPTAPAPVRRRPGTDVRAELIRAGATMTVSLNELRSQLAATASEDL
jgi:hypothetical protein